MITYSGVHIQKIGGVEGTPTPEDIAVHAGRICRFGGAVWYPLLPHLVFVGLLAYKRTGSLVNLLWGFLHDAHEVATSDVPRPFKCDCMRTEQAAIDERLRLYYLPRFQPDYDLIKRCDDDACDIEAMQMHLPGFAQIEMEFTKDYRNRNKIHDDQGDQELFHKIMRSPFGSTDTICGQASSGVTAFEVALRYAEDRNYGGFMDEVRGWELL